MLVWQISVSKRAPNEWIWVETLIARLMGPSWGPSGADRTQVGPMLAPWPLLSGTVFRFPMVHQGVKNFVLAQVLKFWVFLMNCIWFRENFTKILWSYWQINLPQALWAMHMSSPVHFWKFINGTWCNFQGLYRVHYNISINTYVLLRFCWISPLIIKISTPTISNLIAHGALLRLLLWLLPLPLVAEWKKNEKISQVTVTLVVFRLGEHQYHCCWWPGSMSCRVIHSLNHFGVEEW